MKRFDKLCQQISARCHPKDRLLAAEALDLIAKHPDGMNGFLQRFRAAGFDAEVASWTEGTTLAPLSEQEVEQALGSDAIMQIADRVGVGQSFTRTVLGYAIPQIVREVTRTGFLDLAIPSDLAIPLAFPDRMKDGGATTTLANSKIMGMLIPVAALGIWLGVVGLLLDLGAGHPVLEARPNVGVGHPVVEARPNVGVDHPMVEAGHDVKDVDTLKDLDKYLQKNPADAAAFYRRGQLYAETGDFPRAIKDFDETLRLRPKDAAALNNRCWARAMVGGDSQTALKDCNEALQLRPVYADALDSRGFVKLKIGEPSSAIGDYEAALQIKKQASSLYGRGIAKKHTGDSTGGDSDIIAAKQIDPAIAAEFDKSGIH
jgi:uncharacterized protein YidB (DUF937 family)